MNAYKKILLIAGVALAATQAHGMSVNEIKNFFTQEVLRPAQQAGNFFNQNQEQVSNSLATASTIIKDYITEQAGSDAALMHAFEGIDQARRALVNGLEVGYDMFFRQPHELNKDEEQIANKIVATFKVMAETSVPNIIATLKNVTFYRSEKKTAREFLELFGNVIIIMTKAALEDFTTGLMEQQQKFQQSGKSSSLPRKEVTQPRLQLRSPLDAFPGLQSKLESQQKPSEREIALFVLGLPAGTKDSGKIREAYKALLEKWHPDYTTELDKEYASKVLTMIVKAYNYLTSNVQAGEL